MTNFNCYARELFDLDKLNCSPALCNWRRYYSGRSIDHCIDHTCEECREIFLKWLDEECDNTNQIYNVNKSSQEIYYSKAKLIELIDESW